MGRLTNIENELHKMIEEDVNNPEIYNQLVKLVIGHLMQQKACDYHIEEYYELPYLIASDLYMRTLKKADIKSYLGYLDKIYKKYVNYYRHECGFYHHSLDTELENLDLHPEIYGFSYEKLINKIYLSEISSIINYLVYNSKYKITDKDFNNLKISISLSLMNNEYVYFHLDEEKQVYVRYMVRVLKEMIRKGI